MVLSRRVELAVDMTCDRGVKDIQNIISKYQEIDLVSLDAHRQIVVVDTVLPIETLLKVIRESGVRALVKGQASIHLDVPSHVLSCILSEDVDALKQGKSVRSIGLVRVLQITHSACQFDYTFCGLPPSTYVLAIHCYGDLSLGSKSIGDVYRMINLFNVGTDDMVDITEKENISADDLIGRSLVLYRFNAEKYNSSMKLLSHQLDNTELISSMIENCELVPFLFGVVARSSGILENAKRICSCSGKTLWEETDAWKEGLLKE